MGLLIALLWAVVYVAIMVLVVFLILWLLQTIAGVALPEKVVQLLWIIVAIIAIIVVITALTGHIPPLRVGAAIPGGTAPALSAPTT